jgi:hypothetical protein
VSLKEEEPRFAVRENGPGRVGDQLFNQDLFFVLLKQGIRFMFRLGLNDQLNELGSLWENYIVGPDSASVFPELLSDRSPGNIVQPERDLASHIPWAEIQTIRAGQNRPDNELPSPCFAIVGIQGFCDPVTEIGEECLDAG